MKAAKTNSSLFYSIGLCLLMGIVLMSESRAQQTLVCPKNIDFELGNLSIWKPFTGSCCPIVANTAGAVTGRHTIVTGAGTDPFGGFPIVPAGGGLYALKLGNSGTGAQAEKARYHVRIPTGVNNYSLIYRYAVVFQDPGHTTAQQPRFEVKTFDSATNQSISCNTHTYIAASNIPGFTQSTVNTSVYYKSWSTATINLSGYAGKTVIIDFASGDCSLGGHFGYGYVDLSCGLFQISTVACKKQPTSTMSAPPGFQSYQWLDSTKSNVLGTSSTLVVNTPTKKTRYYVVLTPYTGFGCPDTLSTTITVTDVVANYNIAPTSKQCFKGNAFTFANTSTTNSTPLTYAWSFGDGNTSTLTSPSKSYLLADSFKVRLIASTPEGCKDTISKYVTVYPSPQMGFSINDSDQCFKNHNFIFTNTTSLASGSKTNYWTFGDGTNSSDTSPSKTYLTYGNYTVKLKIISDKGCSDSISKLVLVYAMPKAKFSVNDSDQCFKNHNFIFTNNSSIPVGSNTYNWHFGDGSSSTVSSPSKTYATADSFIVRLIATSNNNCQDTAFKPVVTYAQPLANFSINDSDQCFRGHQFVFTNSSTLSKGSKTNYWTFGDGTSSSQNNPSKTYSTYGNYTVKLKVISDKGCSDSISKQVLVFAMPKAKFTVNDSDQCFKNHNFVFTNNSSIPVGSNTYNWHFGDGSTSSTTSPSKTYATADSFMVRLIATSNNNCNDTAFKPVVTYAQPLANFSINDSDQCFRGHQFVFTNSSTLSKGSKTNYWTFGDGTSSSQNDPSKTYSTYGNYTVKLKVISDKGCSDSISKLVLVYAMPKAKFSVNDSDQCFKNHNFIFTNNSSIPVGSNTYNWNFGDGSTSTVSSPSKTYATADSFIVRLIATSNNNCQDTAFKPVVTYAQPLANFSINDSDQCFRGHQFVFTNSSTLSKGSKTNYWTFGDGTNSSDTSPSKTYSTYGNYTVKLKIVSDKGCSDSISKLVLVYAMPKAKFSVNDSDQCFKNHNFIFTNNSSIPVGSNTYNWHFGDGSTSTVSSPSKTYSTADSFMVRLIATSNNNCQDTAFKPVVTYAQPLANFSINDSDQCFRGHQFVFTNNSTLSKGSKTNYWTFGDGTSSSQNDPIKTYSTYGNYTVKLKIVSDKGCSDSLSKQVLVYAMPKAKFSVNDSDQCFKNHNFIFTNNSSIPVGSNTYNWHFGDGSTSTVSSPSKTYATADSFMVRLIATSNNNCQDTAFKPVVTYAQPLANFSINDSDQCFRGHQFVFTNSSTLSKGSKTNYWTFGDGTSSSQNNPSKTYSTYGNYTVKLKVISDKGCSDSISKQVLVYAMPKAKFTVNDSDQCFKNHNFIFTNNSSIPVGSNTYNWNFGDGSTSSTTSPSKTYSTADSFMVRLIATSNNNCQDTAFKPVVTYAQPLANFSINDSDQCFRGHQFVFTNSSTLSKGSKTNYWTFGDGTSSSQNNPSKIYSTYGNYTVKLKVISDKGCSDSISKQVLVYAMPKAKFSVNDSDQCFKNHNFIFTNNSTISVGSNTYNWNFGDGSTSTNTSPSKTYATADSFMVRLIATSNNNCKDTAFKPVVTYAQPLANFSINDSDQCFRGHQFVFTNSSTLSKGSKTNYWTFGDGTSSSQNDPIKTYSTYGNYTVKLKIVSDKGCSDSLSKQVLVYAMPKAKFSVNDSDQCFKGHKFIFTNNTSIPVGTSTYVWQFGDSSTSNLVSPSKQYAYSNTFNIKLFVVSDHNCTDTTSKIVYVYSMPKANFSRSDTGKCFKGNQFIFTNTSQPNNAVSSQWTFGDGFGTTVKSPSHSYTSIGVFTVKLIVGGNAACSDTIQKTVEVYPMPKARFTMNDSTQCLRGNQVNFINQSSIAYNSLNYLWRFGNGDSSVQNNAIYTYPNYGVYTAKLIAISQYGCRDTTSRPIEIYPMPKANFTLSDTAMCLRNNRFTFTNSSSIPYNTLSYQWRFGDGAFSNLSSCTHSYLNYGVYQVKLMANSNKGCFDTIQKTVEVYPMPKARFTMDDSTQCLRGNQVNFINQSSIAYNSISYLWRFGNVDSSSQNNPICTYPNYGVYNAKLIVISQYGCRDTTSKPLEIYPMPVANFDLSDTAMCLRNNVFTFNNSSSIPYNSLTYQWRFGDGAISNLISSSHSYGSHGVYQVQLIANSDKGCSDTLTKMLEVYPMPKARFTMNDSTQCLRGNQVNFINQSSIVYNSLSYLWRLANGDSSSQTNTSQVYSNYGLYNVKLIVISQHSCRDTTSRPLEIYPMPKASFTILDTALCLRNNRFTFINNSSIPYNILSYQWQFGDGGSSGLTSVNYSYGNYGVYQVRLVANSNKGCTDTIRKTVEVYPMPKAQILMPDSAMCLLGNQFQFNNASSIPYHTLSYEWRFGDGASANTINSNHKYSTYGLYTITLIAKSAMNCRDTFKRSIEVYPMPLAQFRLIDTARCLINNRFVMTNQSGIPHGVLSYKWLFGDNDSSFAVHPSHSYNSIGLYPITLIASSNHGCKDTVVHKVSVYASPKIKYAINQSQACLRSNRFLLQDQTVHPSKIKTWNWTIYNANANTNSSFTTPNVTISFNQIGKYYYRLIVTDTFMCADTIMSSVNVYPQTRIQFTTDTVCFGFKNQYASQCSIDTGVITQIKWHFGDGQTALATACNHQYAAPGQYNVMLTTINEFNCKDTLLKMQSAMARQLPVAGFNYAKILDSLTCTGYQLTSTSQGQSVLTHAWDFNGIGSSSLANPFVLFTDSGLKWIQLKVTDVFGCQDQTIQWIKASPETQIFIPNAFTPNRDKTNDLFKPFGVVYPRAYEWLIVNRWGEILFQSNDYLEGWDGTYKGERVPDGVYAYQLKVTTLQNKKLIFSGTVHVLY